MVRSHGVSRAKELRLAPSLRQRKGASYACLADRRCRRSLATLFVVGCTQSTSSSVAPSAVTAPTSAQAAPGASYDGSGSWHFHATARWQNGAVFNDEGDATFT